jgi:RimJ/RimL family protein N-acetyltransferase
VAESTRNLNTRNLTTIACAAILIGTEDTPPANAARFLLLAAGAESARLGDYDRVLDLFDGSDEAAGYVRWLLDDAAHGRAAPFVQRRADDGVVVGCTRFLNPLWPLGRVDPDEVEIGGTWLSAAAQRTPINSEAKLLLLTHAFDVWKAQRVAICTDARNEQSRRAIERIGATFEGVVRRHRRSTRAGEDATLRDTATYSIIIDEWPAIDARLRAFLAR